VGREIGVGVVPDRVEHLVGGFQLRGVTGVGQEPQARHHRVLDTGLRSIGSTLTQWGALRAIGNLPDASPMIWRSRRFRARW
jgi:hypothetical protein